MCVKCEGPLGRSRDNERFPLVRGGGFDADRSREHDDGFGRRDRDADDWRNR